MDFLKEVLGDELFNQVSEKVNAHNGNEANKDKQIKIGNLSSGEYIGIGKYDTLKNDFNSKDAELIQANKLIESLKGKQGDTEGLEAKIKEYETEVENLKKQNESLKIENALKYSLKENGGIDVDYLVFKAKEHQQEFELDDNGKIKGIDDLIKGLKTSIPTMFESEEDNTVNGRKVYDPQKLPKGNKDKTITKDEFRKMSYAERAKLRAENPEAYESLKK